MKTGKPPLEFEVEATVGSFTLQAQGSIADGITALFGASGSGKTTLLHVLAGLQVVNHGSIQLRGEHLLDSGRGFCLPPEKRRIGVVFQEGRLFPHLNVGENMRFGMRSDVQGAPEFDDVTALLELRDILHRRGNGLSGGERQRVALARALLAAPRLLLLDEPLASLDRARRAAILPYLRMLPERYGIPALYVSHDLTEVLSLTDRLIVLDHGRVIGSGSYRDLALSDDLVGRASPLAKTNVLRGEVTKVEGEMCWVKVTNPRTKSSTTALEIGAIAKAQEVGSTVRLLIGAEELVLATGDVGSTSIQNHIPGRVLRRTDGESESVIEIEALSGGTNLLAEVTLRSANQLELNRGAKLTVLFKATAVKVQRSAQSSINC